MSMNVDIEQYISKLDTDRFGFKIAKIDDFSANSEIISKLKELGVKMIIARINSTDLNLVNFLEKKGFLIQDIHLIYNFSISDKGIDSKWKQNNLIVRDLKTEDIPEIIEITANSFKNYGHYFNDPLLPKDKNLEVYTDWANNCCINTSFANKVLVVVVNDKIAGYLAFKDNIEDNYTFAILGAVSPNFRKIGVFQALNKAGINYAMGKGLMNVRTAVLNTNFSVNGTYIELGFKIIKSEITLHYWF